MALLNWNTPPQHFYTQATSAQLPPKAVSNRKIAVVWFKHDLRTDDHSALVTASKCYDAVLPLYIFDRRIISRFSDETLEMALLALKDLKLSLKDQGSDLMIRFGGAETVLSELVEVVGRYTSGFKSIDVFAEEEVEYDLRRMMFTVEESLLTSLLPLEKPPKILMWQPPFYDIKNLKELPAFYSDFKKLKYTPMKPLGPPLLPQLDINLNLGTLPTFEDVKKYLNVNSPNPKAIWTSIKRVSAISILRKIKFDHGEAQNDLVEESAELKSTVNQVDLNNKWRQMRALRNSLYVSSKGNTVVGGSQAVVKALVAYLKGTSTDDWRVQEKSCATENSYVASFGTLFGSALLLGVISRRKVYYEAMKYERDRKLGFQLPFGLSASLDVVAAASDTVCSMEWYWLMALKSQVCKDGKHPIRIWRWNGYLIQYTVVGHEGPAIVLVHGFGAFLEHYRDNFDTISASGNRVYAVTLLGFGKSEKPNILYTEIMWAELLRDFIVDVVGEPAHLVGNSIGGYLVANVAGLWPCLVKSMVLINTAGWVVEGKSSIQIAEERQISGAAWAGSRLLLLYLRSQVGSIVRNCYPINNRRADDWLINEMQRASYDPGVLMVLESVFTFNLSIPLNYLIGSFGGKVLVIQGMKDPLSNSEKSLTMFRKQCNGIVIKELEAGHCPHDERPDDVNPLITEWVVSTERLSKSAGIIP